MIEDACQTCAMWRRGYRNHRSPFAWSLDYLGKDPTPFGACRLGPSSIDDDHAMMKQVQMHQDDWCAQHKTILIKETP